MTESLRFPSSNKCLDFLHSWRVFSLNIGLGVDISFLLAHEKYCATSFWPPWFLMRNLLLLELIFPYRWRVIFPWLFLRIFFFSFPKFNCGVLVWISLVCPNLEFTRFLYMYISVGLSVLSNLGSFQSLYHWVFFKPHVLSSLFGILMPPHHSPARIKIETPHLSFPGKWGSVWCK